MSPHDLVQCDKCQRAFHKDEIENHKILHEKEGDICIMCGLGMMAESEDHLRITCEYCSTTWVKQGHEKPLSERM